MLLTSNPIGLLLSIYNLTDNDFAEISGIPISIVASLRKYDPISTAGSPPAYAQISNDQYHRIAEYFETPFENLKTVPPSIDISSKDKVILKIKGPDIAHAAYEEQNDPNSDYSKRDEAIRKLKETLRKDE